MTIIFIAVLLFIWVGQLPSEILRFLVSAFPYLYLLSADGVIKGYDYCRRKNVLLKYFIYTIIIFIVSMQFYRITTIRFLKNELDRFQFQQYIFKNENNIKGAVWISNPQTLVFSNLKAAELMYYPVFDIQKINDLHSKLLKADFIFFDSDALTCRPQNDLSCQKAKEEFIQEIKRTFKAEMYQENDSGEIVYGIFKK